VTLVDKSDRIGGMLNIMRRAPMRQEMAESMLDNFTKQLEGTTIDIQLNRHITKEDIVQMNPDIVILAVGSGNYVPHYEGVDSEQVSYIDDLFTKTDFEKDDTAAVFDFAGDWSGVEGAIYL